MELDFGQWEGLTRAEIIGTYPQAWETWVSNPEVARAGLDGELGGACAQRGLTTLVTLAHAHPGEAIAIVGHNTLNRLLIARSLDMPLRRYRSLVQANCGLSVATVNGDEIRWLSINQTAHLSQQ
jgi:broad specificity phosphatase PhoE